MEKMMKLNDRNWKEFKVKELFEVLNSKPYHKKDLTIYGGVGNSIPYVSRTNRNNGIESVVEKTDKLKPNPKNSIVFGAENATFFFQPFKYITGNKIYVMKNKNINKFTGLFLQQSLNTSVMNCGFSY